MIAVKQIDQAQLAAFVALFSSGSTFSGNLLAYINGSGTFGPNVVYTYSDQTITGNKTFLLSPHVPYSGDVNSVVSAQYIIDYITLLSGYGATTYATPAMITGASGVSNAALLAVSGSLYASITGASGVLAAGGGGGGGAPNAVFQSGDQTISGLKTFIGAIGVGNPTATGHAVNLGFITGMSGILGAGNSTLLSGYLEANFVHKGLSFGDIISGLKTFTGALTIGNPTNTGHAVNLGYLTGVSGSLQTLINNIVVTGVTSVYNLSGITGNFINMGFWFDQFSLATGLNMIETPIGRDFTFTGYMLGTINTGTQGFFSGSFYQRTPTNTKINFVDFSLNSGVLFSSAGGFSQIISGLNRVGIDIYRIGTGFTGVSVGLFGVGY